MDNKAQIQIQFNWIFVIIVGAVILGFFLSIIFSQQEVSETKISISLANQFNTIITTTNQKIGTVKEYKVPKVELKFVCLQGEGVNYYSIGDLQAKDTKHDLFFSAETLQDDVLYTWTQEWRAPYGIATFMYLTNSESMYAFVTNATKNPNLPFQFEELTENFANNLTSRFIYRNSTGEFVNNFDDDMNMDQYTYIFLNDQLPRPTDLDIVDDATIIIIIPEENDVFAYGKIYFFDRDTYINYYDSPTIFVSNNMKSIYLGKASLYAAIFSGSADRYECGMDKALERYRAMNYLHMYKIDNVLPRVNTYCAELLNGSSLLDIDGAKQDLIAINDSISVNFGDISLINIETLYKVGRSLDDFNSKIAIEANCPLVY